MWPTGIPACCTASRTARTSRGAQDADRSDRRRPLPAPRQGRPGRDGTVCLAEHGPSKRRVALKIIRPELESSAIARNRFLRECESLERIDSPHVVEVLESGAAPGGEIYLVMERLEGVPLGERTDEGT